MDARNRVIQATLGNGNLTYTAADFAATGQSRFIAVDNASGAVHRLDYTYDNYGNVDFRSVEVNGVTSTETLDYDLLQRLLETSHWSRNRLE